MFSSAFATGADPKHLCRQNCMHKMLDEFLTSTEGAHTQPVGAAKAAK